MPRRRAARAGGVLIRKSQIRIVFEVCVLASKYSGEGQPARGAEARPELRDRETYYAELRFAVHCQSRSIPQSRPALDDQDADLAERRPDDESWDDMIARFGDTWT
jgi:hypothetical protein